MKTRETPSEAMARTRRLIQSVGAPAAAQALIEVCQDKKAPSPARATAGTSLLRAAGLFEKREDGSEKEPHEMDRHELAAARERLEQERLAVDTELDEDDAAGESGAFA